MDKNETLRKPLSERAVLLVDAHNGLSASSTHSIQKKVSNEYYLKIMFEDEDLKLLLGEEG